MVPRDRRHRRAPRVRRSVGAMVRAEGLGPGGAHLVKAARAVDRPVVPRQERNKCLATALRADRGVHFALTASPTVADAEGSILLRDRAAARTTLGLVDQALLSVELLLTGGEDEVHPAVSTVDGLVGVHPTLCLLFARHGRALDGLLVPLPGRALSVRQVAGVEQLAERFAGDYTRGFKRCIDARQTLRPALNRPGPPPRGSWCRSAYSTCGTATAPRRWARYGASPPWP
jgi:hypothetical protein